MNMSRLALIATVSSALFAGCASNVPLDNKAAPVESRNTGGTGAAGGSSATSGANSGKLASVDLTKNATPAAEVGRVVYFDYDSFVIKDEFRPVIEGQARALSTDKAKKLTIEGHTDERGGSEYNLALGQKRAESVAKSLKLLGVTDAQIEAVSFGKERPAAQGHDEAAWAKNRRAELANR
jgi:peptidoglycan-associated lipoprotein